jgi:hypothetical protein
MVAAILMAACGSAHQGSAATTTVVPTSAASTTIVSTTVPLPTLPPTTLPAVLTDIETAVNSGRSALENSADALTNLNVQAVDGHSVSLAKAYSVVRLVKSPLEVAIARFQAIESDATPTERSELDVLINDLAGDVSSLVVDAPQSWMTAGFVSSYITELQGDIALVLSQPPFNQ